MMTMSTSHMCPDRGIISTQYLSRFCFFSCRRATYALMYKTVVVVVVAIQSFCCCSDIENVTAPAFLGPLFFYHELYTDYYFVCQLPLNLRAGVAVFEVTLLFDGEVDSSLPVKTTSANELNVTFTPNDFGGHFGQLVRHVIKLVSNSFTVCMYAIPVYVFTVIFTVMSISFRSTATFVYWHFGKKNVMT